MMRRFWDNETNCLDKGPHCIVIIILSIGVSIYRPAAIRVDVIVNFHLEPIPKLSFDRQSGSMPVGSILDDSPLSFQTVRGAF